MQLPLPGIVPTGGVNTNMADTLANWVTECPPLL